MKAKSIIALMILFVMGLSACSQNWYDNNKHKTFKKPITHKIQPHQKEPQH